MFISYAQNFEDVMLWRALGHIGEGFYIDVGANDPMIDSVTKAFYERGWRGINIEPIPVHCADLQRERPRDINLPCAVGEASGEIEIFECEVRGWATAAQQVIERHTSAGHTGTYRRVPMTTLAEVCRQHAPAEIHFLKIDVEGYEHAVLRGMDFGLFRPWIVVAEATVPNSALETYDKWEHCLLQSGYMLAYTDGLNRYYVAHEHSELLGAFKYPPNVFDNFKTIWCHQAEISAHTADARANTADARANAADARAHDADARANAANARAEAANSHAQLAKLDAERLQARLKVVEAKARKARTRLAAIKSSLSWRATRPIRKIAKFGAKIARKVHRGLRAAFHRKRGFHFAAHPVATQVKPRNSSPQPSIYLGPGKRTIYYYVDHTAQCPVNTGMQRVTRGLARFLIESGEQVVFVRWDANAKTIVLVGRADLAHLARWQGPQVHDDSMHAYAEHREQAPPIPSHFGQDGNWLFVPEVTYINFHGFAVTLDLLLAAKQRNLRTAFVFYDAIPLRRTEFQNVVGQHEAYMKHLMLADLVLPISRWSERDLVSFLLHHENACKANLPLVEAVPLPGQVQFCSPPVSPSNGGGSRRQFILSVGTIDRRKNQHTMINAFLAFCARHPKEDWSLILVGNLHEDQRSVIADATAHGSRIQYKPQTSDEELSVLYQGCAFTVFPSLEEGFGLPIVESLAFGKPCICANFGAMAEASEGGGCVGVDVANPAALSAAIENLALDPERRAILSDAAAKRKVRSWVNYGQDVAALLDRAANPVCRIGTVYYWIDATSQYPANSGIQRVARSLARGMMEIGLLLVPVKWDRERNDFCAPSRADLDHMARWNGPSVDAWAPYRSPNQAPSSDWLLVAEVLNDPNGPQGLAVNLRARQLGLRSCWVFYDAIPWKMRDLYPAQSSEDHGAYMRGLDSCDLVLPISQHSCNDLIQFIFSEPNRSHSLFDRIRTQLLPGEFHQAPRVLLGRPAQSSARRILCVGTVEPRKNHLTLLKAFAKVVSELDRSTELWLAGGAPYPELADEVERCIESIPGVHWERNPSDERLWELYDAADFTVYPSTEEGFGLPILESLWHGKPCICAEFGAMAEIADAGGCLTVDVANPEKLARAIICLARDTALRDRLIEEAVTRPFKTWQDYARGVTMELAQERDSSSPLSDLTCLDAHDFRSHFVSLEKRPLLSVCITTFNRADWLALNLQNLTRLLADPRPEIEIVVCDNTSTDHTPDVVAPYLNRRDFRYHRNTENVGMLGNLRVTADFARGDYIWILGDDDLVRPGGIEKVLEVIRGNPGISLIYLNYAYTLEGNASKVLDLEDFLSRATPITTPMPDLQACISRLSTLSENFFTAIYCLVFRRDHALRAFTQDTSGRPFSTMLTCIPSTHHVLKHMMNEQGYWIGEPQLVVNMNVSWMKYASIWILERLPEAFDLAEKMGAPPDEIRVRRIEHLKNIWPWYKEMLTNDPESNMNYFALERLVARFKDLPEFRERIPELIGAYERAAAREPERFTRSIAGLRHVFQARGPAEAD